MTLTTTLLRWTARLLLTSVDEAIDWEQINPAERFSDERLAEAIDWDEIDVYDYVDEARHLAGPTDVVIDLVDEPERIYVWQVATAEAEAQVERQIRDEYRETYGREPHAAHFVVSDLEQLREFDPDQLHHWIDPGQRGGEA